MTAPAALSEHEAELPPSLARYFLAMESLLFGGGEVTELRRTLGTSPSTDDRFAFYQHLVVGNPRRVLRNAFRASHHLCDRQDNQDNQDGKGSASEPGIAAIGLFARIIEEHLVRHPPGGWDLTEVQRGFPATIEALLADGWELPHGLDEVADFEALRHRLLFHALDGETPGALHPSVELRTYTYDVPALSVAVRRAASDTAAGDTAASDIDAGPSGGPVTCLFHRDRETHRFIIRSPDLPQLVALAEASGEADADAIADAGVTEEALSTARAQLQDWGVLVSG